jgi:hypothetical protein
MNYYDHPFCSNSDLTSLRKDLLSADQLANYEEALRFGVLVHAMILEPHNVDLYEHKIIGQPYDYSEAEFQIARKMRLSFLNDSFCRGLLTKSRTEVEMYNEDIPFEFNGIPFTLNTRRKYDGWLDLVNWGWDLKSTTATNQAGFESAIRMFDYDRARVFYAVGPGAIQDCIIGISKVAPYRIFKVFMKHGDSLWISGHQKMNELAFKYWALKGGLV